MLGFLLDRLGMEKQRGPGTSLKAQHKTGQMWVPELGQERRSRWGSGSLQRWAEAGGGVGEGQGPMKCLASSPGKGASPNVSIFSSGLSYLLTS